MVRPGKRCLLVVDDDPSIRLLLMTFLRRKGFQTLEASNGREALTQMRTCAADLVIMDLMMPEVSGWDVLRERNADASLQQIPIIVVTAQNIRETRVDIADDHVAAVLGKPFDLDVLLRTVRTCLEDPDTLAAA